MLQCRLNLVKNIVWVSINLDLDETPSHSASYPDPSCLLMVSRLGPVSEQIDTWPPSVHTIKLQCAEEIQFSDF